MRKTTTSGARPKCAQSAIPSPGTLETSPTELHDHTSRCTTTGPLPCKVHVELRRLTHRVYHRRPSAKVRDGQQNMEDAQVEPVHHACSCRDNLQQPVAPRRQGSRGPSPSRTGVFGSPPLGAIPTLVREYLLDTSLAAFSLGCQPGSYESAPCVTWSVIGTPPLRTVSHCTGQVATDPQSPKGGSQRACPTRGAHPTASGLHGTVAVRPLSLWVASPGDLSQPPVTRDRSLGRRPSC